MRKKLKAILVLILSIMLCLLSFPMLKEIVLSKKHGMALSTTPNIPNSQIYSDKSAMHDDLNKLFEMYYIDHDQITIIYDSLAFDSFYFHNESKEWFAASTYKLPLAMLIIDDINEGLYKLDDRLEYTLASLEDGEINEKYMLGDFIEIEELLYNSLVYSDNAASLILLEKIGDWLVFEERATAMIQQEYSKDRNYDNDISPLYASALLKHLHEHQENYDHILQLMALNEGENATFFNDSYNFKIYSKTGWYEDFQHEIAIVESENPFTLVLMYQGEINESLFTEILNIILKYSDASFA